MKTGKTLLLTLALLGILGTLLIGCGKQGSPEAANPPASASPSSASSAAASETPQSNQEPEMREYTDYVGHTLQIPASPQRVIFVGETFSDLFVLNVKAIGTSLDMASGTIYLDKLADIEDVGFPINLEKTTLLNPDLIIIADTDEKVYDSLSIIAPTVVFDTFAPLEERLPLLGDIVGKKQEAVKWLDEYNLLAEQMWKALADAGVTPGETASVFTYYPGDRLFVMARTGLSQVLYGKNGFQAAKPIQEILDAGSGFKQISPEVLPEFAGDYVFVLNPFSELTDAVQSTEDLLQNRIWLDLPAAKAGRVYRIDINRSGSDALTREWLIQELPKLMAS